MADLIRRTSLSDPLAKCSVDTHWV